MNSPSGSPPQTPAPVAIPPWPIDWLILPESIDGLIPSHDVIQWRTPGGLVDYKVWRVAKGRRVYRRAPPPQWGGCWRE